MGETGPPIDVIPASGGSSRMVGRYALYDEIAMGGMATVHFGRLLGPVGFARTVAIKRLHPQFAKDPEFAAMFLDEARLAARIQHPNVVQTLDVVATDGELFVVMEYVQGESLSRLARAVHARGERIPPSMVSAIVSGALHGLHAAHEAKNERGESLRLVHRDVSPQNVLVSVEGVPRVLDFGVAKAIGRAHTTREGTVKGKLSYMAPEHLSGDPVTRESDVYSASIVLWELLAGRRLFEGETEAMIVGRVLEGDVAPPSRFAAGLPRALDDVVLRGLARNPSKRFATARDMAGALERAQRPALGSELGEWVKELAGETLRQRAERVAEIERSSSGERPASERKLPASEAVTVTDVPRQVSGVRAGKVDVPTSASQVSSISVSSSRREPPKKSSPMRTASVVVLALAIGGAAGWVGSRRLPSLSAIAPAALPPPASASASPPSSAPSAVASVQATASASATPSASASAPPAASARPARPSPRTAPRSPKADCRYLDAKGIWQIRPECL